MMQMREIPVDGYEKVLEVIDKEAGLHSFLVIHDSTLGPALGGVRIYPYKSPELALTDVLRLAKGMTYKSALARVGLGGGKSVIIADPHKDKTPQLLLAFASALNALGGRYIAAEDVGSSTEDLATIKRGSRYVAALATETSSGDPSPYTAWGVYQGIRAVFMTLYGSPEVQGRVVGIQGVGAVGSKVASLLFWNGASLILRDVDTERVRHQSRLFGTRVVGKGEIYKMDMDIFCPCALGGTLNDETIALLQCKAVAGSANNQLLTQENADMLRDRGILYAPDFVINAGGIINAAQEFSPEGYDPKLARDKVNVIYDTLQEIFHKAKAEKKSTDQVAIELALYNLTHKIGKREGGLTFSP